MEAATPKTRPNETGGYDYLHPTKGWKRVSYRRVIAQQIMEYLLRGRK